ncbi:MAG: ABC transporter substrate-binding protein [Clostridia bacterium]|nr:ABC transporter substrate-binding protein [Clostridia bacterium]
MKKLLVLLLALAMVLPTISLAEGFDPAEFAGSTLNVYNWGEYVDMSVIRAFEKEYNVRVNYKTYESNEYLWLQLQSEDAWDVIVPSDYMIERLIAAGKLQPLDKSIVDNLDNLAEGVQNLPYDPDNTYSVPYFWQTVGIVYDTTKIDPEDMEAQGWNAFQNADYAGHAYMYDSSRDAFMIAEKSLGYSANTTDEEEIMAAYEWLRTMHQNLKPSYVTDEVIDSMAEGLKWMALVYSGDAAYILSENEDMAYCTPEQGTNLAVDAMVIPANAKNPKLANVFIKYMLEYDASEANSLEVGYTSANAEVLEALSGPGGDYEGNDAYLPRAGYEKDEMYVDLPAEWQSRQPDLWAKVMAE